MDMLPQYWIKNLFCISIHGYIASERTENCLRCDIFDTIYAFVPVLWLLFMMLMAHYYDMRRKLLHVFFFNIKCDRYQFFYDAVILLIIWQRDFTMMKILALVCADWYGRNMENIFINDWLCNIFITDLTIMTRICNFLIDNDLFLDYYAETIVRVIIHKYAVLYYQRY